MFNRLFHSSMQKKPAQLTTPFEEETAAEGKTAYTVVNSEQANYGKIKRMNYRVIVPRGIIDGELISMFKKVASKKCDEVTVWCYNSREEINQYKPYTVAMLEKTKKTAIRITRR